MRARHYAFTPEAAASNSIALVQSLASAGSLSLSGTYGPNGFGYHVAYSASNLRPALNLTITALTDLSAVNFTFTYIDAQLNQQQITVAGPNATTANVGVNAVQVVSVTASAAAPNVSVGHTVSGYGPWKSFPARRGFQGSTISVGISGTANLSLDITYANICDNETFTGLFDFFPHPSAVNKAASFYGDMAPRVIGYRLKINSWTSGEIRVDHAVAMVG